MGKKRSLMASSCVLLMISAYLISQNSLNGREGEAVTPGGPVDESTGRLVDNVTRVEALERQIESLNAEITGLKLIIEEKTEENEPLSQQAVDLNNVLGEINAQVACLEKSEQMWLVVNRLQNPIYQGDEG